MSGEQREEKRAYSWLLPAPGTTPDCVPIDPPMEPEAHQVTAAEAPKAQGAAPEAPRPIQGTDEPRQVAPAISRLPPRSQEARRSTLSISRLGSMVLLAWSALAGAGEVLILAERGRTVAFRAGLLGLVWIAVAVAIWFFSMRGARGLPDPEGRQPSP